MYLIVLTAKDMDTLKEIANLSRMRGDAPSCAKRGGNHKTKNYASNSNVQCNNCVRHSRNEVDHIVNSKLCLSLESKPAKTKDMTDHGY